jgi:hypothetical protein
MDLSILIFFNSNSFENGPGIAMIVGVELEGVGEELEGADIFPFCSLLLHDITKNETRNALIRKLFAEDITLYFLS